ncbi:hypothetical protein PAPHI01_1714 [Pancytospora philotis]|nr:hypothetical protein PAPHI01_1714 [Pancytospora philotis]
MEQPAERSETKDHKKRYDVWATSLLLGSIFGFYLYALWITHKNYSIWSKVLYSSLSIYRSFPSHLICYYLLYTGASLLLFVTLMHCPRACIRVGLVGSCIAPLLLCYHDLAIGSAIWFASTVVTGTLYYFAIKPHLDCVALILNAAASAVAGFVLRFFGICLLYIFVAMAHAMLFCICFHYLGCGRLACVSMLFIIYHLCGTMGYIHQASCIYTAINCISQQQSAGYLIFWKSLKSLPASQGAICFAALLRGIAWPLKLLDVKMVESNPDISGGRSEGYLLRALRALTAPLRWLCISVVEPLNNMLLPYFATHNICYTKALSESAALVNASNYKSLVAFDAFDYALYPLEIVFAVLSFLMSSAVIGHEDSCETVLVMLCTVSSVSLFHAMVSTITSAIRGFIYVKIVQPDAAKAYNSKISDALDELNSKLM